MIRRSRTDLVKQLKKEGMRFTEFTFEHIGRYEPSDADWNYKDVPHLHHLHQLVEAIPSNIGDDLISTINLQEVLGLRLPMSVVNYESGKNSQTYYTTVLFFVLIIETRYFSMGVNETRVETTYSVGCTPFWIFAFPLIRWALKRNYKDLMSEDIPMRLRRGFLRTLGYTFKGDHTPYSFEKTMHIMETNVVPPAALSAPVPVTLEISQLLPTDGRAPVGADNHFGLRLERQDTRLMIFPRMCMHEGASLDTQKCENGKLKCPWHGRIYAPLAAFDIGSASSQHVQTTGYDFTFEGDRLTIAPRVLAAGKSATSTAAREESLPEHACAAPSPSGNA